MRRIAYPAIRGRRHPRWAGSPPPQAAFSPLTPCPHPWPGRPVRPRWTEPRRLSRALAPRRADRLLFAPRTSSAHPIRQPQARPRFPTSPSPVCTPTPSDAPLAASTPRQRRGPTPKAACSDHSLNPPPPHPLPAVVSSASRSKQAAPTPGAPLLAGAGRGAVKPRSLTRPRLAEHLVVNAEPVN